MARMEQSTVVGVFQDRDDAEHAIDDLHRAGFTDEKIGFVAHGGDTHTTTVADSGSSAGEGAVGGMLAGAGIGGFIAAAAALLVPGFGPVLAGGILASALGGAAVGAAAGGILGALIGAGVPEEEARWYESEFRSGRILVTVRADGRSDEAREILYRHHAYDVHRQPSTVGGTTTGTTTGMTSDWSQHAPRYRQSWQNRYGSSGGRWEDFEPGYRFGHEMANDPRWQNREWTDIESDLGREYGTWGQRYGYTSGDWTRHRDYAREAWEENRRLRRAA